MNLDELLRSIDSVGAWSEHMHRQGSLTWSRDLSKMTVEEIWRDIQQQNQNQKEADNPWRNAPFGEMTLDDFLVKAGVIADPTPIQQQESNQWMQIQLPSVQQPEHQNNLMAAPMQGHHVQQSLPVVDAAYPDSPYELTPIFFDWGFVRHACSWAEKGCSRRCGGEDC
ncbi:ABSCISIC ACID-INSENSITIVE 5-LIKE PROTEIN 2-RELATED [Salix purpurea]|uniref:ABSCISIC ACID-INSENSITIVE 5-LIKE PROTEIN 2-RELATED n=1 Tax=Salix purpurea TaxID=77065 RepID=A0A9Q0T420_SALPP|nr:ABSCISIC ACID-INSENSITIVE 5-LIKE PROTEIN 2-RELATED [Salix purpurea]